MTLRYKIYLALAFLYICLGTTVLNANSIRPLPTIYIYSLCQFAEVCVNPGCVTEVEQTCKVEGTDVSCDDIPPSDFEQCADGENMVPVEQCYKVSNVGPTCGTITTFDRTTNGETRNLLEGKPANSLVLCPGQEMEICETKVINTCEEDCYNTSVEVVITMADGSTCEATDVY